MFTRLIESKSQFMRNDAGTAASTGIHILLITVAAFFTTAKAAVESPPEDPTKVHWIRPSQPPAVIKRAPKTAPSHSPTQSTTTPVSLAVNISPNIPDVAVTLAGVRADDFGDRRGESTLTTANSGVAVEPRDAYETVEVEVPATVIGRAGIPVYPPSLRSAGIEGRVVAQFIVDVKGQARPGSVRILSSSNDLFSESVRDAVGKMKFTPARIGGKPVAQLVQQLFVFKLDR